MPRYFFNLRYGEGPDKVAFDQEGDELADLATAQARALKIASDMIAKERSDAIRDWFVCSFEITDADAHSLLTVPFCDTVPELEEED